MKMNIVQVEEFWDTPEPLLMMPYFRFGNLRYQHDIAREKPKELLFQALTALAYLHSRGVAHRDLKPENILVESLTPFKIKLADFGFANDKTDLNTFCGTADYAAPELYAGGNYEPSVDVWSLGVILLEYTYGLPEAVRERHASLHNRRARTLWCRRVADSAKSWASESNGLIDLTSWMLRMKPETRPSASECLMEGQDAGFFDRCIADIGNATPTQQTVLQGEIGHDDGSGNIILGTLWGAEASSGYYSDGRAGLRDPENTSGFLEPRPFEISSTSHKRQRSPTKKLSDRGRNKRRQPDIRGSVSRTYRLSDQHLGHDNELAEIRLMYDAVLALLMDLQVGDCTTQVIDDHTGALIRDLCEYFTLLEITEIGFSQNSHSEPAIITACANSTEFVLARLTSCERINPTADLAAHLLHMVQLQSVPPEAQDILESRQLSRESSKVSTQIWNPAADRGRESEPEEWQRSTSPTGGSKGASSRRQSKRRDIGQVDDVHHPEYPGTPKPESNGYLRLPFSTGFVAVRTTDFRVNATHIIRGAAGQSKNEMTRFLEMEIPSDIVRPGSARGTYVDFPMALQLCQKYDFKELGNLLQRVRTKYGTHLEFPTKTYSVGERKRSSFDGFLKIDAGNNNHIYLRTADTFVNLTQAFKAEGYTRHHLKRCIHQVSKTGSDKITKGPILLRGTYVDIQTALQLCQEYHLDKISELLKQYGYRQAGSTQPFISVESAKE